MAFVLKTAKTLRNHWKKSTFAALLLMYGYGRIKNRFQTHELMRVYCEKALKYGEQTIPVEVEPRTITVILNPSANKRKASDEFDKYCAPILHLAGISVNVIKTESEGHAKTLINDLESTDALVVAGGDGTVSEVVTGLLRRTQENTTGLVPLGILPLGRTNTVAKMLYPCGGDLERVRALADATLAVVEEVIKPINVLRVEVLESDNKPIYAVAGIKWGAYRDAESRKDNYWLYGRLRNYAAYLFSGYKSDLTWLCEASLKYSPPCMGCSNCTIIQPQQKKWFSKFTKDPQHSFANVVNPECQNVDEKDISTVDFTLSVPTSDGNVPKVVVEVGPETVDYFKFVSDGWKSENGQKRHIKESIEARSVEIKPKITTKNDKELWFSIDNESYELKPVKVTLLPRLINVFCKKDNLLRQ